MNWNIGEIHVLLCVALGILAVIGRGRKLQVLLYKPEVTRLRCPGELAAMCEWVSLFSNSLLLLLMGYDQCPIVEYCMPLIRTDW